MRRVGSSYFVDLPSGPSYEIGPGITSDDLLAIVEDRLHYPGDQALVANLREKLRGAKQSERHQKAVAKVGQWSA